MRRMRRGGLLLVAVVGLSLVLELAAPAAAAPEAAWSHEPASPRVGEVVTFDGRASYDPTGRIVLWEWQFGDGGTGHGPVVQHVYHEEGGYLVTLRVVNDVGVPAYRSEAVFVAPPPLPEMRPYAHPSGFRIPIPMGWDVIEDETFGGTVFELIVSERTPGTYGFLTNVLVDTDRDFTVRESEAYLDEQARIAVEEVRRESPNVMLEEGPTQRTIANHSAVSVVIRYVGEGIVQKLVLVVSDPHDRYWFILLSTSEPEYPYYNRTFEAMLGGFEITAEPVQFGATTPGAVGAGIAGVVAALLLVFLLRRSAIAAPPPARADALPPSWAFCPRCGSGIRADDRFCPKCGRALEGLTVEAQNRG